MAQQPFLFNAAKYAAGLQNVERIWREPRGMNCNPEWKREERLAASWANEMENVPDLT
jgi:hypothetical protein